MGTLGGLQVGSASRFSSDGKVAGKDDMGVNTAQIATPPEPGAYQNLRSGPEIAVEYEANQALSVDGSDSLLRTLSPFMIRVEPPMVLAAASTQSKTDFAKILDAGHGAAPAAYQAARNAIDATLRDSAIANTGQSVEAYVAQGSMYKPQGPDGSKVTNQKGDGTGGPSKIGPPAIADLYTAVDIAMQLRALVNTPPLVMLINPSSLSIKYTKKQQYTERTRNGYVFQAWGEDQPRLSIEARCGAFYSGSRGVQWASRRDSAAWQNLMTAFRFYQHNGYIYDTVGKSQAHHFVGALSIHYDQWVYYGSMESFNYTLDEAAQLGGVTFSMEFVVNAMVDTAKNSMVVTPMQSPVPSPSDPRYAGLGAKGTQGTGTQDLVIGGEYQPIQYGPADFYTVTGASKSGTATTPMLPKGSSGTGQAAMGDQGFLFSSAASPASAPAAMRKPAPFRSK